MKKILNTKTFSIIIFALAITLSITVLIIKSSVNMSNLKANELSYSNNVSKNLKEPWIAYSLNQDKRDEIVSMDEVIKYMIETGYINTYNDIEKVKFMNLNGIRYIEDISSISEFKNLEYIEFSIYGDTNIEIIKDLANIKKIVLYHKNVVELDFISNLNNLEELDICCEKVRDYDFLLDISNLKKITIRCFDADIDHSILDLLEDNGVEVEVKSR